MPAILPVIIVSVFGFTIIGSVAVAWVLLRHRETPGSLWFGLLMLSGAVWALFAALDYVTTGVALKFTLGKLESIGVVWTGVLWLKFVIDYTGRPRWFRRIDKWLFVVPAVSLFLALTTDWHGLFWDSRAVLATQLPDDRWGQLIITARGPAYWVFTAYNYLMVFLGIGRLIWMIVAYPQVYRRQAAAIIIGVLFPVVGNVIYFAGAGALLRAEITPFVFMLTAIVYLVGVFRLRMFDMAPIARDTLFETLTDGIIFVDRHQRIGDVNRAALDLLHTKRRSPVGQQIQVLLPDWSERLAALENGDRKSESHLSLHDGETPRYVDVRVVPVQDRRAIGWLVILNDVTERKLAEAQALELALEREQVHMLRTFIQNASHDLKTPIAQLQTSAYLTERLLGDLEKQLSTARDEDAETLAAQIQKTTSRLRERAENSNEVSRRLGRIVENMLELLQLDLRPEPERDRYDLNQLVTDVAHDYVVRARARGLRFEIAPEPELPSVAVDAGMVRRALQVVLDNALQYTGAGGSVQVTVSRADGMAAIEVADTGIGIMPEALPRIFDRFYRADPARSVNTGGAGLGLSIARRIVETHGGTIEATSVPQQGTTFRITLPLEHKERAAKREDAAQVGLVDSRLTT